MRLLVDPTCDRLTAYLRICGHDTASAVERGVTDDDDLLALAARADRRLVTRSDRLAARAPEAVHVAEGGLDDRLRSLRAAVSLRIEASPTRCGRCNGRLDLLAPDAPAPEYAPAGSEFDRWRCRDCGQVFWKGGHWERVRARLAGL